VIDLTLRYTFPAAFSIIGPAFDSVEARAHLIAIGLQESQFKFRAQVEGPARGLWQFERGGGVAGVLAHPKTSALAVEALTTLRYHQLGDSQIGVARRVHVALEHNDVLAAIFARLLLYTVPAKLPQRYEREIAWHQYLQAWRPGKPHPDTWAGHYRKAWDAVTA
jgi:hypothetical protein